MKRGSNPPQLTRNTLWNLAGQVGPLVVGLVSIPPLIGQLGTERFGILALIWVALGYLSLFDLGMGRALTQVVAARRGRGLEKEAALLTWTGLAMMLFLGLLAGAALALATPWLLENALNIPRALVRESAAAFYLVSLALPAVIASAGLRGVLEGWERFDLSNQVRLAVSSLTYLAPLAASFLRPDLGAVVASLGAVRLLGALVYLWLCLRVAPGLKGTAKLDFSRAKELLHTGGWMAVSNLVSPILVNLDRFVIGSVLTMTAVAYYATPYEVVTKLLVLPAAVSAVLFPAFSRTYAGQRESAGRLFLWAVEASFFLLFPLVLVVLLFAPELLRAWVGAEFARNSSAVARVLAVGVLLNGLAHIPFVLVQGAGRADLTGKLHLLELPLYVAVLWWLTSVHGVLGAAVAWTARVSTDAVALFAASTRLVPPGREISKQVAKLLASAALLTSLALLLSGPIAKSVFLACTILGFPALSWRYLLREEARSALKGIWSKRLGRA